MKVVEIREISPWEVLNDLCFDHWDKVGTVVKRCLDGEKEDDFSAYVERVFRRKARENGGKMPFSEEDVKRYILDNTDEIAKALKLKEEGDDE